MRAEHREWGVNNGVVQNKGVKYGAHGPNILDSHILYEEFVMLSKLAIVAASFLVTASALAVDEGNVTKSYPLKDGSTVYVFKDGKMAMEDKLGRLVTMKEGHTMETTDGQRIMMKGNEIWRLERELHRDRGGS